MKREFLQEFKVEGKPLPKEVIDAIMAANGRDIQKVKGDFADYDRLKEELEALRQSNQQARDHAQAAAQWEQKYNEAVLTHRQALDKLDFERVLQQQILKAGGRNERAISALLDLEALAGCEDRPRAVEEALAELKKESGYLFTSPVPPLYARDTGAWQGPQDTHPTTLAGALREKFERK